MCRKANLRTTGTKAELIERLEFRSAQNTLNFELIERVRELENTIMRRASRSADESSDAYGENDLEVRVNNSQSAHTSTPQQTTAAASQVKNTNENMLPMGINNTQPPATSVNIASYAGIGSVPQNVCTASAPQYSRVSMPQYTQVPNMRQYVPEYAPVSAAPYVSSRSLPQHIYVEGRQPYVQGPVMQPGLYSTPVSTYVQPPIFSATPVPVVAATMNLNDIMMVLPEFDPTALNSLSAKQFVQRVQTLKEVYQWREDILVFAAQRKLRGHAKSWVDSQNEVFVTWAHFANKLIETFPFNSNAADAHIDMANTKRAVGETPQEYYYKMLALGNKYGMLNNEIAKHIINGINEPDLKKKYRMSIHHVLSYSGI